MFVDRFFLMGDAFLKKVIFYFRTSPDEHLTNILVGPEETKIRISMRSNYTVV